MGVKVREKQKGSGVWWVFISHHGKRKAKRIGKDKSLAKTVAKKIEAKLVLGEMDLEKAEPEVPTFGEVGRLWITQPHDWKESTRDIYRSNLADYVYPTFGKTRVDQIPEGI